MTTEKLFEEYTENPPTPVISRYMYENSGHKLLCPKCQDFRRTKAEIVQVESKPYLRITCKTCETYADFVLRYDCVVPKTFIDIIDRYARKKAKESFKEAIKHGDSS